MKFLKLLQPNAVESGNGQPSQVQETPVHATESDGHDIKSGFETIDSAETKVSQAILELFESRRSFQTQIAEDNKILTEKDAAIAELIREKLFLETKTANLSDEITRLQEDVAKKKSHHEQLANEFNAYKTHQADKLQKLQDALHERELSNQQLLMDFNQYRQKSQGRAQQMENQLRDQQVKYQHLEKKYNEALNENSRLDKVIKDFVAKAAPQGELSKAR